MITASIVLYHHDAMEIRRLMNCILAEPVDKLYLIDNSLNDRLRNLIKESERIRYIHSVNLGYGAGHNIALREAMGEGAAYHVVVNPDIYFEQGTLVKLADYMNRHPRVGLVMPKVFYPDGEIQYLCKLLPTPFDLIGRRFITCKKLVEKANRRYELRFADYDQEMRVPSLSGCFMFLRMDVIRQTGGFDERYFMYAEDLDLCRRIGDVAETVYFPSAVVYHAYEKGSYKNMRLLKYHICSVIKYFNKWGWFFDSERRKRNRRSLALLSKQK